MYYVVAVVNMAHATTILEALQEGTARYGVYNDEDDVYDVFTIQQIDNLHRQNKAVCAFEVVYNQNSMPVDVTLPAGAVTMLPFCDTNGKSLNKYSTVILYKTFAVGGIMYTVFDVKVKHAVCVTEKQLINHIEYVKQNQCVTAALLCHKRTDNTLYLRAYTGSFPVRNKETIKKILDIREGILYGVKNAPIVVQTLIQLPQEIKTISLSAITKPFANILKDKHVMHVQDLPENLALLLSNSNISEIKPIDTNKAVNWLVKGNSIYQEKSTQAIKCVYCMASQSAENVLLTTNNKDAELTVGNNVLCKLHAYKSVILKGVYSVETNAFNENVIDVLSIKDRMPVFNTRALSKTTIRAIHLYGSYTAEELARILDIRAWWGIDDITDVVPNTSYRTVKFYCNSKTARLLQQTLPIERVIEVN